MVSKIQCFNALSTHPSLETALVEVVSIIKRSLTGEPDLGILFVSSAYASEYSRVLPLLLEKLPIPVVIGCGGAGVIGTSSDGKATEIEGGPGISLTVAQLPNVKVSPFCVLSDNLPDMDSPPQAWTDIVGVNPLLNPNFIVLADPFSSKVNDFLQGMDFAYPTSTKVGGLASASLALFPCSVFYAINTSLEVYTEAIVGVALSGEIVLETILAQGCRPIGPVYEVTEADRKTIIRLTDLESNNSGSPLEILRQLVLTLTQKDRNLVQDSLFIGVAREPFKILLERRDFLIRTLVGVDSQTGTIAIGDRVRYGQKVQFHLRDAETSAEDLEMVLHNYRQNLVDPSSICGVLMFSCLGRGHRLYSKFNFDSDLFNHHFPKTTVGGFFTNGEIGPVGDKSFLHGYTAALAIIRQG